MQFLLLAGFLLGFWRLGASLNPSKFDDGRRFIKSEAAAVRSAGARAESSDYGLFVVLQLFSQFALAKPVNRFDK